MVEKINAIFVDEDPRDSERYTRLLTKNEIISVLPIFPPSEINQLPLEPIPDLIVIDYLLTNLQPSGITASYRGGTLANYISEQLPEIPLVLLSTRSILNKHPNYEDEIRAIDCVLYKDSVNEDPEKAIKTLLALSNGFKTLKTVNEEDRTWMNILVLLRASENEEESLQKASPPRRTIDEKWGVKAVSKWILRTLFKYPGIFYDSLFAASALGINESSFQKQEVQEFFKDAYYTGVFSDMKKLWWKDRLLKIAFTCIREAGVEPRLSDNFMTAFYKTTENKLEPSICIFSDEEHANTVCYILNKPVKMKYTLGYLPDDRPESLEQARISFTAAISDNVKEEYIPKADAELLPMIRRGEL